jgi:hypothetical protein
MEGRERVAEFGRELREGPEPSDRSIKEIIDVLRPQLQELVDKQLELARTELAPGRQEGGLAGRLARGRGRVHVRLPHLPGLDGCVPAEPPSPAVDLGSDRLWYTIASWGILAGAGASILRNLDPKPHRTIRTLQQNVNWVKGQFRS